MIHRICFCPSTIINLLLQCPVLITVIHLLLVPPPILASSMIINEEENETGSHDVGDEQDHNDEDENSVGNISTSFVVVLNFRFLLNQGFFSSLGPCFVRFGCTRPFWSSWGC